MRKSFKLLAAAVLAGTITSAASAATVTVSSVVDQSGFIGLQNLPSYPLTNSLTPYDFTGQVNALGNVTSVDSLTVTITSVFDGDTGPGDYDFNNLFLALDGVNTGLALNGLTDNTISTITLSQLNPALQAALITALQDGKLVGTILDISPGNSPAGDIISIPSIVQTSLDLTLSGANLAGPGGPGGGGGNQVPLPAAALLAPLGAGLAGMYARRFRKVAK